MTIADVAEAAQVSTATAYRSFSNPNDLVLEAAVTRLPASKITDLPDDPADRIDQVVRRLAEFSSATRPCGAA